MRIFVTGLILFASSIFPLFLKYLNPCIFSVIALLIGAITVFFYTTTNKNVGLTDVLRSFLKEPPGRSSKRIYRYLSIWIFLSLVFQISWIFDSIRDAGLLLDANTVVSHLFWHHIYTLILAIEFMFLLPLTYIKFLYYNPPKPKGEKPLPRKVLFVGLSLPKGNNAVEVQIKSLNEHLQKLGNPELPNEESFKELDTNWVPPLRAILHENQALEKVIVIVSNQTAGYFNNFIEFLKLIPRLKRRIESGDLLIIISRPVDMNDFSSVKMELDRELLGLSEYSDFDISFNLTGGTAPVSAAMVLEAVVEGRQAEYIKQSRDNPEERELIRIDVTERDVPIL